MKHRPWSLVILSIMHFLAPFGNILINSFLMKISFIEYALLLWTPANLIKSIVFILIPVLCAICIYSFKKWSYQVYILLMLCSFVYSFLSRHDDSNNFNLIILFLFYFLNILVVSYFMIPNIRDIYFNSKIRWWESKPRYVVDLAVEIHQQDQYFFGKIKNISEGGFFIEIDREIALQDLSVINFKYEDRQFILKTKPVFHKKSIPIGFGFQITDENSQKKKDFKKLILHLREQSQVASSLKLNDEDTFIFWLKNPFKKTAWLPKNYR